MALINTTTTGILGTTVYGDGAGALTVQQDGVTINKITTQPVWSVGSSSTAQTIASSTFTKVAMSVEQFDSANAFDSTTNYRFTAPIAGYYQVNADIELSMASTSNFEFFGVLAKNADTDYLRFGDNYNVTELNPTNRACTLSHLIYLNVGDYLEIYAYQSSGASGTIVNGANGVKYTRFSGYLVKAA